MMSLMTFGSDCSSDCRGENKSSEDISYIRHKCIHTTERGCISKESQQAPTNDVSPTRSAYDPQMEIGRDHLTERHAKRHLSIGTDLFNFVRLLGRFMPLTGLIDLKAVFLIW